MSLVGVSSPVEVLSFRLASLYPSFDPLLGLIAPLLPLLVPHTGSPGCFLLIAGAYQGYRPRFACLTL